MNNSRTKNTVLILVTSSLRQIITILLTFLSRTVFIRVLGAEYLGINGLFSNILSILALSELGIGQAITFYLYKPLVNKDYERIKSLMKFYEVCYRLVGFTMIGIGCCVMPFLPKLVNFNQNVPVDLYLVYFLYLINSASSYLFFAYKQTLIIANQEQYKIEKITIIFSILSFATDILVLIFLKNYIAYLMMKLIITILGNIAKAVKIDKEYPFLKEKIYKKIQKSEVKIIFKDIGNVALFRIGSTLFNATDNIMISIILGTIIVGYYSNYFLIFSQVTVILNLIITSIRAGIGNVIAKETKEKQYRLFRQLDFIVYLISSVFAICLFQLSNSFINLWLGKYDNNYVLSQIVVTFLCISFYFDSTTQILDSFRTGSGHFKIGHYLQLIGGGCNIVLDVILGKTYGLTGIFLATVITKGLITIIPFIIKISMKVFLKSWHDILFIYIRNFIITIFVASIVWMICYKLHMGSIFKFILEMVMCIIISISLLLIIFSRTTEMHEIFSRIVNIKNRKFNR